MLQELHGKIDAKETFVQSKASNLVKQALKESKISSKKASPQNSFTLQNLQNSHKRQAFLYYQKHLLLSQDAHRQNNTWQSQNYAKNKHNYNYNRSNRFNRDNNRNKSKSRSRSIVFYSSKESPTSNLKSTYLQSALVAIVAIKPKQFKPSNVEYFYLDLSEDIYALNNYIISEKDVFYRDVYMFTQQVKRVVATKNVDNQLYLYLRKSTIIWFTSQSDFIQIRLLQNANEFCTILIAKYKIFTSKTLDKLQTKHYIVQNARKERLVNNYVQTIIRYSRFCDVIDFAILIYAWKDLDNNLRRDIRQSIKYTISNKFVEALKEIIEYYESITKNNTRLFANAFANASIFASRFNKKKTTFQRDVKSIKRRLLN